MKLLQELTEMASRPEVTLDQLLTPQEQRLAKMTIRRGEPREEFEQLAARRLREMGLNVPMNIGVFLKWAHALDQRYHPEKFKTPDTSEFWRHYGKAQAEKDPSVVGIGPGGGRTWTGD